MPVELRFRSQGVDTTMVFDNTMNDQWFDFTLNDEISIINVDPDLWLLKGASTTVVGTEDLDFYESDAYLFPTVANDLVNVSNIPSDFNFSAMNVVDMSGRVVPASKYFLDSRVQIAVSHLPQGVYFVQHPSWVKPLRFIK